MPHDKPPSSDEASRAAFAAALRMLALRDLSEAQLRERLERKDFPPGAIEAALARLTQEGTLDDRRTAVSRARTELFVRGRGRVRVLQQLRAIGIDPETAEEALADAIGDLDEATLVERALNRHSRGRVVRIEDQAEFRRLYRYLTGQGFTGPAIMSVLRARSKRSFEPRDET